MNSNNLNSKYLVTEYSGLQNLYFGRVLKYIIKIGNLNRKNINILDYGCGKQELSKMITEGNVINYDINPKYSDINSIDKCKFDLVVINHVLLYIEAKNQIDLFKQIKNINPNAKLIIGIGKQNTISKILKTLALTFNAHQNTKIKYREQVNLIYENTNVIKKIENICFMTDVFLCKLK